MWESIKNFFKKYWQIMLLVVVVVVGYWYIREQDANWGRVVDALNDSHQIEVETINKAREDEAKQHAEQLKAWQESVAQIKADYARVLEDLEKEKSVRRHEIVQKYGNDAEGLANLMAENFGFVVKSSPQ